MIKIINNQNIIMNKKILKFLLEKKWFSSVGQDPKFENAKRDFTNS
jgi:hypothetical protein